MNIEAYIASGIIEEYCLGLLDPETAAEVEALSSQYPDIDREISATLRGLEVYTKPAPPPPALKGNIMALIEQLEQEKVIDLAHPPFLHRHSDPEAWRNATKGCIPDFESDNNLYNVFHNLPDHRLCVVWINQSLTEEGHEPEAFQESFLVLEGECKCDFEGQIFQLKAGDYLDIPPRTRHSFMNISPAPLTAVKVLVQRRRIA